MTKIFMTYRRADSRKDAGRIYDRLVQAFGKDNIFKDVDSIPIGKDFRGIILEAVAQCDVQLVIIGRSWLTITDEKGQRRLDNPEDYVRIEIESALQRDRCTVIPVLVDGAPMPSADELPVTLRELAFKNAAVVRDDPDFHPDVTRLIQGIGGAVETPPQPAAFDVRDAIKRFYSAFDGRRWDDARQLLAEIRASGRAPRVFDVDQHERQLWEALEEAERDREYQVLRIMATRPKPTGIWEALQIFWQSYPGYDPDDLARFKPPAIDLLPGPFAWVEIPGGRGTMETDEASVTLAIPTARYWIGKYPVTNAQYAKFIEAGGYRERRWWTDAGWAARQENDWTEPRFWDDGRFNGAEQPVVGVSWYEAVAFCRWLSDVTGEKIMLPTEAQWQYAAQGGDGRAYPWGNEWDCTRCNNSASPCDSHATTPVRQYEGKGDSPFGVVDMAGNVWEWCATAYGTGSDALDGTDVRVLRGGSWVNIYPVNLRAAVRYRLIPDDRYSNDGFRCARSS